MPAKAGIQSKELGPRFRGDERREIYSAALSTGAVPERN
jgi:hypothetical protein